MKRGVGWFDRRTQTFCNAAFFPARANARAFPSTGEFVMQAQRPEKKSERIKFPRFFYFSISDGLPNAQYPNEQYSNILRPDAAIQSSAQNHFAAFAVVLNWNGLCAIRFTTASQRKHWVQTRILFEPPFGRETRTVWRFGL